MTREIFLPISLNLESYLEFSKKLKSVDLINNKELVKINITNFSKANGRVEPFGALMTINSLRLFARLCSENGVKITLIYTKEEHIKNTYAKSLRFYGSLGLDIGDSPDVDYQVVNSKNFIPIIKTDFSSITQALHEQDEINTISKRMARVLSKENKNLYDYTYFCINEILRNVLEHSGKKEIWYCAQYWPTTIGGKLIEVCIMDEGMGIHTSLINELGDEEENILKFSLVPGCSSKPTTHYIESAPNSGFGLFMTSEIGKDNGEFIIASNSDLLHAAGPMEEYLECYSAGTVICLRLHIDTLKDYNLKNDELINKGLEMAQEYNRYRERKKFAPGLKIESFFK
ncbi:hypothetical protein [Peribacillus frigoritolerans]|uniref:hypothetical protein n=1 Tax=Peribacillus frigoritolerans TaxID=450367 RepID=UPI0020C14B1A|nr:hypothetical protein [Peribacillus frigoritolerans]